MLKDIPLADIMIGDRFRTDLGDIAALAASIAAVGLLHPIVVTPDFRLIAGRRRLAAFAALGRATIPALVLDVATLLQAEFEENERRKALNPSERVAIVDALHTQLTAQAKARQRQAGQQRGRGNTACENVSQAPAPHPRSRDAAAAAVGWSGPTYAKAKTIVDAARQDPDDEALQDLVTEMDRTGNVDGAYRKLPDYAKPAPATPAKPKAVKKLPFDTIIQRLDKVMLTTVMPQLGFFDEEDRENLRTMFRFYLDVIDHPDDNTEADAPA
jgi:ParB-like chromosome segregation protein Spo0J